MEEEEERCSMVYREADEEKKSEESGQLPEMDDGFKKETDGQLSLNVQSYGIDDLEKIDGVSYFVSTATDASNVVVNDEEDFFPLSFHGSVPSMEPANKQPSMDTVDKDLPLLSSSISLQDPSMLPTSSVDAVLTVVSPPIHADGAHSEVSPLFMIVEEPPRVGVAPEVSIPPVSPDSVNPPSSVAEEAPMSSPSIHTNDAPSVSAQEVSPLHTDDSPSMLSKEAPISAPPLHADDSPSMLSKEAPISAPPVHADDSPSMLSKEAPISAPPVHADDSPSMLSKEAPISAPPVHADDSPSMLSKEAPISAPPVHADDSPSMLSKEAPISVPPVHADDSPSMLSKEAPISAPPIHADDPSSVPVQEVPRVHIENSPSVVAEDPAPLIHADGAPLMDTPSMVVEEVPSKDLLSVVSKDVSPLVDETPRVPAEDAHKMIVGEMPFQASEDAPSKVVEEAPSVASKGVPSMEAEDVSLFVNEEAPSAPAIDAHKMVDESLLKVTEDTPSMVDKDDSPLVNQEASPMVDEGEGSPNFDGDPCHIDNENALPTDADEVMHAPEVDTEMDMETEIETEAVEIGKRGVGKRKRGRPARVQVKASPTTIEEEDVCFICFDGGNLVLCDRRGCPKAYHPACVNRDEAFFRAKGRWNCGWHICSNCEKAAQYMCYTCTYSLCKGCIKEAEFFRVRGNRGFCVACMGTVTLIEKNDQAQVDFNDKTSWEYLFKEYWVDLKRKLSLTPDELTQAKNPFKGSNIVPHKGESSEELYDANEDKGSVSDDSSGHLEVSSSKRRKPKRRSKSSKEEKPPNVTHAGGEGISSTNTEWASKELLEFVAHMKNGDKSVLSQFDVQALLLDYTKQNNLRDPRRKSQIVCDSRLENLFGKARVGHFEMLKLLELHFLIKEDAHAADNQDSTAHNEANQIDGDDSAGASAKGSSEKRRKSRKKGDGRGPQTNLDDYAAIDAHNIKLLYLRRSLMEELLEDSDKFHDKVVGSFVRIRISGSGQKHDMYRLVQVIGTQKAAEPYKTSKRSTDVVLEILNLNKTELITIDIISNQEFTEDECKRLRQSIKCGLISPMTVGEVQEKALTLQSVRVNDWLEMEKLRITHLRDRASEQGRRKDLRECVEKLQLLNTPEERSRRLQEIPGVHADPKMDPNYESEEDEDQDDSPQGKSLISRDAGFSRKGRDPISPRKESPASVDTWNVASKTATTGLDGRNMSTIGIRDRGYGANGAAEAVNSDAHLLNSWEKPKNLSSAPILGNGTSSSLAVGRSGPPQDLGAPNLTDISSSINETDKMWHYKDPSGKVQGPFSMAQLRKWSTTGHFPTDLRIWRITETPEDSILLNDALVGKYEKDSSQKVNSFAPPEKAPSMLENNWGVGVGSSGREGSTKTTWIDNTQIDRTVNSNWNSVGGFPNGGIQPLNSGVWNSASSSWTAPTANFTGEQSGQFIQGGWNPTRGGNAWSGQSANSPHPYSRQPHRPASHQGGSSGGRWNRGQGDSSGGRWNRGQTDPSGGRWNRGQSRGNNWNSNRYRGGPQSNNGRGYDRRANNMGPSGQFSGENVRAPFDSRMNGWNSSNTGETPNPMTDGWGVNYSNKSYSSDLPSPTPHSSNANWTDQASECKWSPTRTSSFQVNTMSSTAPTMGNNGVQLSAIGIPDPNTASGWTGQQHLSATPTGGWGPSSGPAPVSAPVLAPAPAPAPAPMRVDTFSQDVRDYSGPPTPTPMPIGNYLQP